MGPRGRFSLGEAGLEVHGGVRQKTRGRTWTLLPLEMVSSSGSSIAITRKGACSIAEGPEDEGRLVRQVRFWAACDYSR